MALRSIANNLDFEKSHRCDNGMTKAPLLLMQVSCINLLQLTCIKIKKPW